MSNKNKALTALKRKKFKTGGSTGTSEKRTGPSNVVDLDNPNKDYFTDSLQAPKADIEKAPAIGYDQAYLTEDDKIKEIASPTDVTEEKVRLKAHCEYYMETMTSGDAQGKKLGFIGQEMGREINTLGSKANHAELQKIVVQMKDELEKIKEQVLNVL